MGKRATPTLSGNPITPKATPWERGRPARKRATGPPHEQAGDAHARGLPHHSQGHPLGARRARKRATGPPHEQAGDTQAGRPRRHWAPRAGGGGRLGRVAPVGALRAFGPLRARCPRSQEHRSQGHPLGARASRPQAGHRPATWQAGDAHARGLLQRPSSAVHPRPASTALGTSGGGVAGSGVSLLSALCGPSARCGQDARAPRDIAPKATPGSAGVPPASGPQARHMAKRATPTLAGFSSARPRQCTQGRPRRHWAPRAGGWPARACRSCRRFAGLRPVAGKMPALPGTSGQERGRPARKRARPPLPRSRASPAPVLGSAPKAARRHWAPRAGVAGSGVSLLSALCGPSARCGQDARAPRTLPRPPPGSAGVPPASGPQARHMAKRATPTLAGFSSARPRQCTQGRPRRHWAPRAGVAGSGVSLLSALCGPSARCGQDARAPRDIAHRATPWERGRPARKRATGPPHGQAGDAHARGLLQRPSSAVRTQGRPRRHWAPRAGVAGSGVSLLSALCGPSARCGQDARAPRDITPRAVPRAGVGVARGCRSCRRFAGLRPGAGKMPALPGHRSQGRASGGGGERAQSTSR